MKKVFTIALITIGQQVVGMTPPCKNGEKNCPPLGAIGDSHGKRAAHPASDMDGLVVSGKGIKFATRATPGETPTGGTPKSERPKKGSYPELKYGFLSRIQKSSSVDNTRRSPSPFRESHLDTPGDLSPNGGTLIGQPPQNPDGDKDVGPGVETFGDSHDIHAAHPLHNTNLKGDPTHDAHTVNEVNESHTENGRGGNAMSLDDDGDYDPDNDNHKTNQKSHRKNGDSHSSADAR